MNPNTICIPSIVKSELLLGAHKSQKTKENLEKISLFLFPYAIIPFDDAGSYEYALIRSDLEKRGQLIGPNDIIIASTVKANNGTLITNNVREFNRVNGLIVQNWI